jgi:hypothetical protein
MMAFNNFPDGQLSLPFPPLSPTLIHISSTSHLFLSRSSTTLPFPLTPPSSQAKCSYYNFAGGGGHSAHDATGDIWRICLTDFVLKTANGREVIASTGPGIENKVMVFAHPSWDAPAGGKVRRRLN